MTRTVIEVRPDRSRFRISLYEPSGHPNASENRPLRYSASDPVPLAFGSGTGGVDAMGAYMMKALSSHPAVSDAIGSQLNAGSGTLLVRTALGTESLPWETLFARGSFLALDPRWLIARQDPNAGARAVSRADFQPPLRILAIFAADQSIKDTADATEWTALSEALERARFPVAVKALVANDHVQKTINGSRSSVVRAEADFVAPGRELLEQVEDEEPFDILHFFCHGHVDSKSNKPMLLLSTRESVYGGDSTVELEASDIKTLGGDSAWLAMLNCCGSAKDASNVGSLAFAVMQSGIPTVTGMREPVSVTHANAFTRAFYPQLVKKLGAVVKHPDQYTDIDWPAMLCEPRKAIAKANGKNQSIPVAARSTREWTLPALYLGWSSYQLAGRLAPADVPPTGFNWIPRRIIKLAAPFRNVAPALSDEQRARIQAELSALRALVAVSLGPPPEVLGQYRSRIAELERQLYGAPAEAPDGGPLE